MIGIALKSLESLNNNKPLAPSPARGGVLRPWAPLFALGLVLTLVAALFFPPQSTWADTRQQRSVGRGGVGRIPNGSPVISSQAIAPAVASASQIKKSGRSRNSTVTDEELDDEGATALLTPPDRSNSLASAQPASQATDGGEPAIEKAPPLFVDYRRGAIPQIGFVPDSFLQDSGEAYVFDQYGNRIYFTIDPWLQQAANQLLIHYRVPWGAIVLFEPKTGKIRAVAGHSARTPEADATIPFRATYPAASLFKMITGAAAVETAGLKETDQITFRGGNYTLGEGNYRPDTRKDRRNMTVGEAMGKSVNPVFGRIALTKLTPPTLAKFAGAFNFNAPIPLEVAVEPSRYTHPADEYELSRTGAGFGDVEISPLHAAMIAGSMSYNGIMMRPYLISKIAKSDGRVIYSPRPSELRRTVRPTTAQEVIRMMTHTVSEGTAKRHFSNLDSSALRGITIAAKTGTLKGDNPVGLYRWFVAAAPIENPQIAVAALVVDMGGARIHGTGLGRRMLDYYFTEDRALAVPVTSLIEKESAPKTRRSSAIAKARTKQSKSAVRPRSRRKH